MLIRIIKWFRGYLLVRIKGYSPERFINLCSAKDILIWDLKQVGDEYEFFISVQGFRQLKQIVKKTKTRPYIKKRYGLPFLLHRYRKRKIFAFGVLLCCILVYTMSLFIWEISISGEQKHTDEAILKFLKTNNIYTGIQKKKVSCQEIEEEIRAKYPDIGWVSAEIRGTRLLIKLKETNMPKTVEKRTEVCHIVAMKDGIITSIITRKGVPLVKEGTVVKKGDILVSGVVEIMGDFDLLIRKETVVSDADIRMKTYYDYKDSFQMDYWKKEYTGKKKKAYSVNINENKIFLYSPFNVYKKYDIIDNDEKLRIGKNFYLPISFTTTCFREYEMVSTTYTKEEASRIAKEKLQLYLEDLEENGVTILENNVKIEFSGKKCVTSGKLIVEESATTYRSIDDSEWRNIETDEHSGNDD
ncbi:sporulation protein YqfD [Anaerosporobacter faecicola]|uniref:sporulation protein YqfD n=1 Tax=Anaerosporobacter faecicola TaxID=2718714 RepID=UPI001438CC21|nr:sporulation protein YqfD [Anaerosporobacter faecicola]